MNIEVINPGETSKEIKVPTLNLSQAVRRFRLAGIPISEVSLGDGIEQGLFPFAVCIKTSCGGRRFLIYETQLSKYLADRSEDAACIS